MAELIIADSELDAYLRLIDKIQECGYRSSRYFEITSCLLSIQYFEESYMEFLNSRNSIINIIGKSGKSAEARAKRVFEDTIDRLTKPSYRKRLTSFEEPYKGSIIEIDQIENIIYELAVKPLSSTLVFNFYRPVDTVMKKRQGYVPCPISGDFKFRKNKLQLNIFFRSQDVLNFFYHDVYYFRKLQFEVLNRAKQISTSNKLNNAEIGELNFHYSRVFIPLSMEWRPKEYVNKPEIMEKVENLKLELSERINNLCD